MSHTFDLRYDARPFTANGDRQRHYHAKAALVKEWRDAFCLLARSQRVPRFAAVVVTVTQHTASRRSLPDTGACAPAAKAAIDGLVDAGVLPGDGPDVVRALTFLAPVVSGADALELSLVAWHGEAAA